MRTYLTALATALALLAVPAAAQAAPLITDTSVSEVTETSATLEASVDPNGSRAREVHFQYITQTDYEAAGNDFGPATLTTPDQVIPATVKGTGQITADSSVIAELSTEDGTFAAGQTITGPGIPPGTTILAASATSLTISKAATDTSAPDAPIKATGPQPVSASITGLAPATIYRFRALASNSASEDATGPTRLFQTLVPTPSFGPCANDPLRFGPGTPFGHPSAALPDCRAYEMATPIDKDGGDAHIISTVTRAAEIGAGIVWGSNFGAPNGSGAQGLPFFAAVRGEAGWQSQGLFPPATLGQAAQIRGWSPDFSEVFVSATRLGAQRTSAFFELHRDGSAPTQITPYLPIGDEAFALVDASKDGRWIFFESPAALPASAAGGPVLDGTKAGGMNVYVWDAASGQVSLVSTLNTEPENEAALPKGAFAGPYDWAQGRTNHGGATNRYYLHEQHALSTDADSLYFTAYGNGQLYRRVNPTQPQSAMGGETCLEPEKACTIHISATDRTPPDAQGAAPAAFQFASADGSEVYLTSSEELTDDANTGPPQPPSRIGRTDLGAPDPDAAKEEDFLPAKAAGIVVSPDGEYIYWADPITGNIGRANLKAPEPKATVEASYINTGETECDVEVFESGKDVTKHFAGPSKPRYVAVDDDYLYWTNSGSAARDDVGLVGPEGVDGCGTIGRVPLDGAEPPKPDFIVGLSNPMGIAINDTYIYWANSAHEGKLRTVGRAGLDGTGQINDFIEPESTGNKGPSALAVDSEYVYVVVSQPRSSAESSAFSVQRFSFDGSNQSLDAAGFGLGFGFGPAVAVGGPYLYWVTPADGTINRLLLDRLDTYANCGSPGRCEEGIIKPSGSLFGLANSGPSVYWSVNGETPPNPGNDLYLLDSEHPAGEQLTDLTPDPSTPNGAEVISVVGGADEASYLYFAANGDLDQDGPASSGDCKNVDRFDFEGSCNLYLLRDGEINFISRLEPGDYPQESLGLRPFRSLPGGGVSPRTARVTPDGRTLLFRSAQDLGGYETDGSYQLYRYRVDEGLVCVSCDPSGETQSGASPGLPTWTYGNAAFPASFTPATTVRFLSKNGNRSFFETTASLVPADTNGQGGCLPQGSCQDVYEWEAPGTGTCTASGPAYSPYNRGCLYLISTGKSATPSYLADASPDGSDVYFSTRERLVGSDTDDLLDVYDARELGGLSSQNPISTPPCENEGCKPAATPPPTYVAPPDFSAPPDPKPKRPRCKKAKKHKKKACAKHGAKRKHKKPPTHKQPGGPR